MSRILQLETVDDFNRDIPGIPMTGDQMHEALGNAVVYVDDLTTKLGDEYMNDLLNALSLNGCTVDRDRHTFSISDLEKFSSFILNGTRGPRKTESNTDVARLVDEALLWLLGHYPTVLDGCGYDNIFFALRHHLYGKDMKADRTYRVVAVFYGKV